MRQVSAVFLGGLKRTFSVSTCDVYELGVFPLDLVVLNATDSDNNGVVRLRNDRFLCFCQSHLCQ